MIHCAWPSSLLQALARMAAATVLALGVASCVGREATPGPWGQAVADAEPFAHCLPLGPTGQDYVGQAMTLSLEPALTAGVTSFESIAPVVSVQDGLDWTLVMLETDLPDYVPTNSMVQHQPSAPLDQAVSELQPAPVDAPITLDDTKDQALSVLVQFDQPVEESTTGQLALTGYDYVVDGVTHRVNLEHHVFVTAQEPYGDSLDCGEDYKAFADFQDG